MSGPFGPKERSGIWVFPLDGAAPRKILEDANFAVPSPDDSQIAFFRGGSIWLVSASGEGAREIVPTPPQHWLDDWLAWSPDSRRVAYGKRRAREFSIESYDLDSRQTNTILSDSKVGSFCWAPDGRIIYARQEEAPNETSANLWDIRIDPRTARVRGKPRRLTSWGGYLFDILSAGAGGSRIAFGRRRFHSTVYVGELEAGGMRMRLPRRLTFDEWLNWPTGWSYDSQSVLFTSDRRGRLDTLRQDLKAQTPLAMVAGGEERRDARISPDGRWILYLTPPENAGQGSAAEGRLMRVAASGGSPAMVLAVAGFPEFTRVAATGLSPGSTQMRNPRFRCPATPRSLCVLSEEIQGQAIFTAFDPVEGRKGELARIGAPIPDSWDLSPDGQWIALGWQWEAGHIRLLSLGGQRARDISLEGLTTVQCLAWAADGKALFAISWASKEPPLVRISLNGEVTVLHRGLLHVWNPVPSPDGRHLAFGEDGMESNVWVARSPQ